MPLSNRTPKTPSSTQNNRLKAEWEPQKATLLCWPHAQSDWRDQLPAAETTYSEIIAQISRFQPVLCLCRDTPTKVRAQSALKQEQATQANIHFITLPTNDTWCRDFGPLSVETNAGLQIFDFQFNGWGRKFPFELDNRVNAELYRSHSSAPSHQHTRYQALPYVLEGGSIDCNGAGTVITTTTCLLNPNRNRVTKAQVESYFAQWFGTQQVLWLDATGLEGDDTDAHIDTLARFIAPDQLVYQQCKTPHDPHYRALQEMEAQLKQQIKACPHPILLTPLPLPSPRYSTLTAGRPKQRLPANYANFLLINDALLLPTYGVPEDEIAHSVLQQICPEREIIPINCQALIEQSGSLHCITMQLYEWPSNLN